MSSDAATWKVLAIIAIAFSSGAGGSTFFWTQELEQQEKDLVQNCIHQEIIHLLEDNKRTIERNDKASRRRDERRKKIDIVVEPEPLNNELVEKIEEFQKLTKEDQ